jgi:ABC transport system ATP-binding/permease protein
MWILRTKIAGDDGPLTFRILAGGIKTMGRATRADFILDAALVSRLHCRFTANDAGALEVEDLRSTNGTFVNGSRVKRARLSAGDCVRVGRVELTVSSEA